MTWQAFPAYSNKHSRLVQKLVNYGQKRLITSSTGLMFVSLARQLQEVLREKTFDFRSIIVDFKNLMRLHHSQDGSTYPRYKLMCFVYISFFMKNKTHKL
jgi:hypothetical protein